MTPDLEALIADLEKAEGPSRELDFRIAKLVWPGSTPDTTKHGPPINFTSSLDAALTLVPEGMWMDLLIRPPSKFNRMYVYVSSALPCDDDKYIEETGETQTASIAPALCIAALKTRAAIPWPRRRGND